MKMRCRVLTEPSRHLAGRRQLDDMNAADLRMLAHFLERLFRRQLVEVQHGDRLAAGQLTAYRHLGDVDLMLAEDGAGGGVGLLVRRHFGANQSAEIALARAALLDDFNAAFPGEQLRIDNVNVLVKVKLKQTGRECSGDESRAAPRD